MELDFTENQKCGIYVADREVLDHEEIQLFNKSVSWAVAKGMTKLCLESAKTQPS